MDTRGLLIPAGGARERCGAQGPWGPAEGGGSVPIAMLAAGRLLRATAARMRADRCRKQRIGSRSHSKRRSDRRKNLHQERDQKNRECESNLPPQGSNPFSASKLTKR